MTRDEAKKIEDAARKWIDCACEHDIGIVLNQDSVPYSDVMQQEQAFLALLNSMIDDTQMNKTEPQIAAYVASAQRQLCGDASCAQEFSYHFLLQSHDGSLHLVYTWHRTRIKHIQLHLSDVQSPGSGS